MDESEWNETDEQGRRVHMEKTVSEKRTTIELKQTITLQTSASAALQLLACQDNQRSEQELEQADIEEFENKLEAMERELEAETQGQNTENT